MNSKDYKIFRKDLDPDKLIPKIFTSQLYKGRRYRMTVCTGSQNPLLLKRHVMKMFIEHCKFSKEVVNNNCKLMNHLKIENEFKEISIIDQDSLESNLNIMKFTQQNSEKVYDHEFIKFEIITKKKQISKVSVEFYRKLEGTYIESTKKLSKEIFLKIKDFRSANSEEIRSTIKKFSDSFIVKWGPMRPRDLVAMSKDISDFKNSIKNIPGYDSEYLDQDYKNTYVEPIELMFENTQEYNLKKVSGYSKITKAIFANNPDNLTKELSKVQTKINKRIGSIKITPLMFACSIFQGFLKKDSSEKNLRIINLLLMYGADISIKDKFGNDAFSYIEKGTTIFGHTKPEKPTEKDILKILNKFSIKSKNFTEVTNPSDVHSGNFTPVPEVMFTPVSELTTELTSVEPKFLDILNEKNLLAHT
jgi:hypothetical protein